MKIYEKYGYTPHKKYPGVYVKDGYFSTAYIISKDISEEVRKDLESTYACRFQKSTDDFHQVLLYDTFLSSVVPSTIIDHRVGSVLCVISRDVIHDKEKILYALEDMGKIPLHVDLSGHHTLKYALLDAVDKQYPGISFDLVMFEIGVGNIVPILEGFENITKEIQPKIILGVQGSKTENPYGF